jgi:hypothetical protein
VAKSGLHFSEYSLEKKAYAIASTDCELESVISVVRFVSGTEPNTIHKSLVSICVGCWSDGGLVSVRQNAQAPNGSK